jgi:hypothetical protein
MTYIYPRREYSVMFQEKQILLTNSLGVSAEGEVAFKHLFTYYVENGRVAKAC